MVSFRRIQIVGILVLLSGLAAAAGVPQLVSYQGRLTQTNGTAVADGNYPVTIRIYDAPSGGAELWSEQDTLRTNSGLFAVTLGKNKPLPMSLFDGNSRYLAVQPDNEGEMFPELFWCRCHTAVARMWPFRRIPRRMQFKP